MAESQGITRHERCGVPVLSMPSRDGLTYGGIVFRVGVADEPLPKRGVCHLIEHVVGDVPGELVESNGLTQELFTSLYAWGDAEPVHRFLEAVCTAVRSLPRDRLERERRILTVEDLAPGGPGTPARMRYVRCGATGFGSRMEHEHGIWNTTDDEVDEWARTYFTTGNCVAYMTGPVPDELDLRLPGGERMPPPPLHQLDHVATPAQAEGAIEEVAVASIATAGPARDLVIEVVRNRVVSRLRAERGVIYDVQCDSQHIDAARSHCCFSLDVFDADAAEVRNAIFRVLSELAGSGATSAENERFLRDCRLWVACCEPPTVLDDVAEDELIGRPVLSPAEYLDRSASVTVDDVMAVAREMIDTAIVAVPEDTPLPAWEGTRVKAIGEPDWPEFEADRIPGRRRLFGLRPSKDYLAVGHEGVRAVGPAGGIDVVALRFDEIVLATKHADGDLTLTGRNGYWMRFDADIPGERQAIATLLDRIGESLIVLTPRHQELKRLQVAAERLTDSTLKEKALPIAAEELRATESIHHVVEASWDDDNSEGLMIVTDRRIILAGAEEDQVGSRPLSDFLRAESDGNRVAFVDLDGDTVEFKIWPFDEMSKLALTVDSAASAEPIEFF